MLRRGCARVFVLCSFGRMEGEQDMAVFAACAGKWQEFPPRRPSTPCRGRICVHHPRHTQCRPAGRSGACDSALSRQRVGTCEGCALELRDQPEHRPRPALHGPRQRSRAVLVLGQRIGAGLQQQPRRVHSSGARARRRPHQRGPSRVCAHAASQGALQPTPLDTAPAREPAHPARADHRRTP